MTEYKSVDEMIELIDEPNRSICLRILNKNRELFQTVQGSSNNHQNWPGGYLDHVQEVMNIALLMYPTLNAKRPLQFSLSDLLLVLFLHDFEKPWKYYFGEDGQLHVKRMLENKAEQQKYRAEKLIEYGINLTPEQENGMKYVEGEHNDYTNKQRVMGPLACAAHVCDILSARLWFDHPKSIETETWGGGKGFIKFGVQ